MLLISLMYNPHRTAGFQNMYYVLHTVRMLCLNSLNYLLCMNVAMKLNSSLLIHQEVFYKQKCRNCRTPDFRYWL